MKFLLSTLIAVFCLSSCSQQRYGTVSKVKQTKKVEATVASNSKERIETDVVINKPSSDFDIKTSHEVTSIEQLDLEIPKVVKTETPKSSVKKTIRKFILNPIVTIPLHPQVTPSQLSERKMQLNQHHISDTQASRGWFYYI